jgi:hypothetical protein
VPLVFLLPKTLKWFGSPIVWLWAYLMKVMILSVPDEGYGFECTWWRLWLWAYLMKVMTLSIPDEGYDFERTWWRLWLWAYLMKVMTLSVPDEGYDFERTWWRLFQNRTERIKLISTFLLFSFIFESVDFFSSVAICYFPESMDER